MFSSTPINDQTENCYLSVFVGGTFCGKFKHESIKKMLNEWKEVNLLGQCNHIKNGYIISFLTIPRS